MKKVIMDGNEVCAHTSYMFTETAGIYPITPSSPMAELTDKYSQNGILNVFNNTVSVVEMQSEAGAAGLVHGMLKNGSLTSTYTASQGLLLMIPNMYKMAGEMLPCVMHVAARSLSTHALSIFGDHQDIYAARMTGFNFLASSSVQDVAYMTAISHLAAIDSNLPFLNFFDGFRTSHELNKVNILELDDVKNLINYDSLNNYKKRCISLDNPKTGGTAQNDDIYFQATEVRNKNYEEVSDIVNSYMTKINEIAKTSYKPFNYYGSKNASKVIVAMGSVCETIKEVLEKMSDVGLIEVHLYRPFSSKYLLNVLPKSVKKIAVLDRTKEFGSREPLYLDVVNVLKDLDIKVVGGRYGLSSKDTNPSSIKAVFDMLDNPIDNFTIGINDDVTNLSLKPSKILIDKNYEMAIYGYGSDGMVSASKSLLKLVGYNTNKYVQGYFQYDSKKSGGVTKGHLRFSDDMINSTYYVMNPSLVVVTKESYLSSFDCLSDIKENGIFVLNTSKDEKEIISNLSQSIKNIIVSKNINFYTIDAYQIALENNIKNKISMIMESVIIKLSKVIDYDLGISKLKEDIKKRFELKGKEVIESNINAISYVDKYLKKIDITGDFICEINDINNDVVTMMNKRMGDDLSVSSFLDMKDGSFEGGNTKDEKRKISNIVPKWLSENCIKCNMCSFVCPHSVIRPFLLSDEEYEKAPSFIKEKCIDKYIMGISVADCTGCGLCIKHCPSREKSLVNDDLKIEEQKVFDYLVNNITCKENELNNIKNVGFKQPKFEFSGACAGCGETPYIKLLTQLFDNLVIANATGCSSIYGGSAPSTPYSVPWNSSLFEDNAEFGYGMLKADEKKKKNVIKILNDIDSEVCKEYINNINNYEYTKEISEKYKELKNIKEDVIAKSFWCIGGDGWAYDIGYGGLDHVMSTNENIKVLVLDTQVYSNTGGQASKATPLGATALFAAGGKTTYKKDLGLMMMNYDHVFVATVSLSNPMHLIRTLKEANNYNGPAIVIAYAPCISHGITGGMVNSVSSAKEAVSCGYFNLYKRNPLTGFSLDSKPNFDLYKDFLLTQNRYKVLSKVNSESDTILEENKKQAIKRYENLQKLV